MRRNGFLAGIAALLGLGAVGVRGAQPVAAAGTTPRMLVYGPQLEEIAAEITAMEPVSYSGALFYVGEAAVWRYDGGEPELVSAAKWWIEGINPPLARVDGAA